MDGWKNFYIPKVSSKQLLIPVVDVLTSPKDGMEAFLYTEPGTSRMPGKHCTTMLQLPKNTTKLFYHFVLYFCSKGEIDAAVGELQGDLSNVENAVEGYINAAEAELQTLVSEFLSWNFEEKPGKFLCLA